MKKLINLICQNIKTKIEVRKALKQNLYKHDELLITFAQAICEIREVVDNIKETNFKEIYYEEHLKNKELLKEVRKLRKEVKKYEKDS